MSGAFVALWIVWFRNEICCLGYSLGFSLLVSPWGGGGGAGVTILLYICFWSYTGRCVLPPGVCVVLPPCVG